jgi:hypothetical protein
VQPSKNGADCVHDTCPVPCRNPEICPGSGAERRAIRDGRTKLLRRVAVLASVVILGQCGITDAVRADAKRDLAPRRSCPSANSP